MGNGRGSLTARQRAREAKAQLDKERAAREAKIESLAVAFYDGQDSADRAEQMLQEATAARTAAIASLTELQLNVEEIATLCGIPAGEVRAYRKSAKAVSRVASGSADEAPSTAASPAQTGGASGEAD